MRWKRQNSEVIRFPRCLKKGTSASSDYFPEEKLGKEREEKR